jgi:hypothetical protein
MPISRSFLMKGWNTLRKESKIALSGKGKTIKLRRF